MMATEIFKIDASWAEKLIKTRVPFLTAPTVDIGTFSHFSSDPIVEFSTLLLRMSLTEVSGVDGIIDLAYCTLLYCTVLYCTVLYLQRSAELMGS